MFKERPQLQELSLTNRSWQKQKNTSEYKPNEGQDYIDKNSKKTE